MAAEVRKESLREAGGSRQFSEEKSRSLILPRPPTGTLLPTSGTLPAVPIAIEDPAHPRCCLCSPRDPVPSISFGFSSPKGRFFSGSA